MAVTVTDKTKCCGCGSCVAICPTHSLSLSTDKKGFCYPRIARDNCTDCGKCERICPILNPIGALKIDKAFAAWAIEQNSLSTSGGTAYLVSKEFVLDGGIVYGCSAVSGKVRHIRVSTLEEVKELCGSKYVQSELTLIYQQIKDDLTNGYKVLFIGVPCQVAAIRNHFKNSIQNLFLIDILCHGVPSQQMLNDHLEPYAKGRRIESISFRNGEEYRLNVHGDGWNRKARFLHDSFIAGFLNSITLRESCTACHFVGEKRYSDVTIGDFWGLGSKIPFNHEHPGKVSMVLPLTDKGLKLLATIRDEAVFYERPVQEAIAGNYPLRVSAKRTWRYRLFTTLYKALPFDLAVTITLLDIYIKKPFQILIRQLCKRK